MQALVKIFKQWVRLLHAPSTGSLCVEDNMYVDDEKLDPWSPYWEEVLWLEHVFKLLRSRK